MVKVKLTYESAKDKLAGVKEELPAAETQLRDFVKKNKIKGGKSEDKKIQAAHDKIVANINDLKDRKARYIKFMKENKPERDSKYDYPSDCKTGLDKKKFRASIRAKAKRAKVDVETYLADPAKYDKLIAAKDAEREAKKDKPKKKKTEEAAPKKKVKVVEATKKKKKKVAAPTPEPEVEEEGEVEDSAADEAEEEGED